MPTTTALFRNNYTKKKGFGYISAFIFYCIGEREDNRKEMIFFYFSNEEGKRYCSKQGRKRKGFRKGYERKERKKKGERNSMVEIKWKKGERNCE